MSNANDDDMERCNRAQLREDRKRGTNSEVKLRSQVLGYFKKLEAMEHKNRQAKYNHQGKNFACDSKGGTNMLQKHPLWCFIWSYQSI